MTIALAELFAQLSDPHRLEDLQPGELVVQRLAEGAPYYAASDSDGRWALAIASKQQGSLQPSVRLEAFAAEFGVQYVLREDSGQDHVRVCVLHCLSERRDIRDLFVVVCEAVLRALHAPVSDSMVALAVRSWVGLFRRLQLPARTGVVGLIGELMLMRSAPDATEALRAWHHDVTDTMDFVFSGRALEIEVKATAGSRRVHDISLAQVTPPAGSTRYVASVLVDLRPNGVEVGAVVQEILNTLHSDDDVLLLWRGLTETCGEHLHGFLAQRFLVEKAAQSVALYPVEIVPHPVIELPLHPGVSEVRFRSDLSSLDPTPMAVVWQ